MATQFDFNSIKDLGTFWDGGKNAANAGGGKFNAYSAGISNRSNNLDLLYQNLLGRNADSGGKKYWDEQIKSGATTYQGVADAIKASGEYTGQQDHLANNPNATADDLRNLGTAYVSPFHWGSGSSLAGWSPPGTEGGSKLTQQQAASVSSDPATGGSYADQSNKNVGDVRTAIEDWYLTGDLGTGSNPFATGGGGGGSMAGQQYDDSGLLAQIGGLRDAFDAYKKQSASDMQNMWNNANWGWGQTVGGVRTQNELPGWSPKKGGTSGFFGRGGRSGKGLTTSSLNI